MLKSDFIERLLIIASSFAIIFCCFVLLSPQLQNFIIETGERVLRLNWSRARWMEQFHESSVIIIPLFGMILVSSIRNIQIFLEKHRKYAEKVFVFASIVVIALSVVVRIIMYVKCRALWSDEAALAESIITRNWLELLTPPLSHYQSAPVLYVTAVKSICSILGYAEFPLRLFSLFAFTGLLVCETVFLKKIFNCNNYDTAFVVAVTALLPGYFRYSNELKPYMGDALFAVLTILAYFYHTRGRIKLPALAALCILFLGFSSPVIFFIGGIFAVEFITAALNKNMKKLFSVSAAGAAVLAVFCLYYYWWMRPVSGYMETFWDNAHTAAGTIKQMLLIFKYGRNYDSSIVILFIPFALYGLFTLCRLKNKIAYSAVCSLFLACFASFIGKWPLVSRLWLFLPAIILIFTPAGINAIQAKIRHKQFTAALSFAFFSTVLLYLAIDCLWYTGDKMYLSRQESYQLIDYVQKNIKEREMLYVCDNAKHTLWYRIGFGATKIGNTDKDNIIFGNTTAEERGESYWANDLSPVLEHGNVYLIFQSQGMDSGLDTLRNHGTLTLVMKVLDTPLYYFERADE